MAAMATTMGERFLHIIQCFDDQSCGMQESATGRFGGSVKRLGVYAEHKKYQGETSDPASPNYIQKIAAGPMESECGKFMIGSCFIVYATRAEAERFIAEDIFTHANVWERVTINRWISIPNGIKPVAVEKAPDDTTNVSVKMVPHEVRAAL